MIIVNPKGGLCNRIRTVNSAYFLAKKLKKSLKIIWVTDRFLGCSYYKLFKKINQIEVIERNKTIGIEYLIRKLKCNKIINNREMEGFIKSKFDLIKLSKYQDIYISTVHKFYNYTDFELFKPIGEIQNIIDGYVVQFDNTIGIHIRRTDNIQSIQNSSIDAFIKLINNEIEVNNKINFFLATDSPIIEENLKSIFGSRILTYKKNLNRRAEKGIQDALVDVMCLSNTQKIIGSYWSSFTDIASEINNIEKVVAR